MKVITIGRGQDNDIIINDAKVSASHLQIVQDDRGNCSAVDLDSRNGTFVNNQRIVGEFRLKANDVVKIGDTVLPWMTYLNSPAPVTKQYGYTLLQPRPQNPQPEPDFPPQPQRTNRTLWYVLSGVVILLLVVAGLVVKTYYFSEPQSPVVNITEKGKNLELLEQRVNEKEDKTKLLQEKADELYKKALLSGSEKDRATAKAKQAEADTSKLETQKAKQSLATATEQMNQAIKERDDAQIQKNVAINKEKEALVAKANAEKAATDAIMAKVNAETTAKLTQEFYNLLPKVKNNMMGKNYPQIVCEKLQYKAPQGKDEKEFIKEKFEGADNIQKQKIINVIKEVLGMQNQDESPKTNMDNKTQTDSKTTSSFSDSKKESEKVVINP